VTEIPLITAKRLDHPEDVQPYLEWLTDVLTSGQDIGIDTETRSIDETWTHTGRGHGRLYQIGTANEAWAIDFQDWHGLVADTQRLVNGSDCRVWGANYAYDQSVFHREGVPLTPWTHVEDVVIAHRLARFDHYTHRLKPAAAAELGDWATVGEEELKRVMAENNWDWGTIPTDTFEYWAYGCMDTCLPVQLGQKIEPDLPQWYEVEMEYQRLAFNMTRRGVLLDPDAVQKAHDHWTSELERHGAILADLGFDKPASAKVVMNVFSELGHVPEEFSEKTGDPTYRKQILQAMVGLGGKVAQAAEHLLTWRSVNAWRNNYGRKLLRYADSSGRIHPVINTMQARTGRSSITEPPLQTIPHEALTRDMFRAEPGHALIAIDYMGQEVRIQAGLSLDPAMLEFFDKGEQKFHAYVSDMIGIPYEAAKTIVYARSYGASAATMARTAGCSVPQMESYLAAMDTTFARANQWREEVTALAELRTQEDGYPWVELPYGRKARLDNGREFTQATNTNIQGHGSDVLKLAMCRMAQAGLDEYFVLPMHDEVLMSVPKAEAEEAARLASQLMEDELLPVRLTTEASPPLERWGDKYLREDH